MPRSSYFFYLKSLERPDKYSDLKEHIANLFYKNDKRYGVRRITAALKNELNIITNHKVVERLMREMGLKCKIKTIKYKSYKGTFGKVADNIINRDFSASKPYRKLTTDVTMFKVNDQKVYLQPILDMFNREIISFSISTDIYLKHTLTMVNEAIETIGNTDGVVLHSDQGWQYQMKEYQNLLKEAGIIQSMSRKGNCYDNAVMENFFGILKNEMYYGKRFKSVEALKQAITDYIEYYNNKRIKTKLNGMSPVEYRKNFLETV